MLSEIFLLIF